MPESRFSFTVEDWKNLKGNQQLSLIAAVAGGITTLVIAIYNQREYQQAVSLSSFASLILTISITLTFDRIARYSFENKIQKEFDRFIMKEENLVFIGGSGKGIEWFLGNHHGLASVRNTVFNRTDPHNDPKVRLILENFYNAIAATINGGCLWQDIYISKEETELLNFLKRIKSENKENYDSYIVEPNVPLFQVMLLQYLNEKKAVLFGWGGVGRTPPRVYLSESPSTFQYFDAYFDQVLENKQATQKKNLFEEVISTPVRPALESIKSDNSQILPPPSL